MKSGYTTSTSSIAVLIKTHFLDPALITQLEHFNRIIQTLQNVDFCLSIDISKGEPELLESAIDRLQPCILHRFTSDYRNQGFSVHPDVHKNHAPVNWFHSDYSLLDFHLRTRGHYEALWQLEYDVYLKKGNWEFLAIPFNQDFMASSVKVRDPVSAQLVKDSCLIFPDWHWWSSLHGVPSILGSFFPCVRISTDAADQVIKAYRAGVTGYCEVSVPSILGHAGARISELALIDQRNVSICHPHWNKQLQTSHPDFVLNTPCLNVDQ